MIRTASLTSSVSRKAGGLFDGVRQLVLAMPEQGVEERVYGVEDEFTEVDLSGWQPAAVSAFKPTWPMSFGYSPRFLEELLAYEPDLTHTHGIWGYPSVATTVFGGKRHCPYLISPHGMLDAWAVRNSRWKKRIAYVLYEGAHLRGARCLRALGEEEARSLRELGLKNDIAIIPNGVELPKGAASGGPPWLGAIEPGKKVLLFLGRIHPKKGLANLLRAWAKVRSSGLTTSNAASAAWVLAIAGWDQAGHEGELKRLATELQIPWRDIRDGKVDGKGTVSNRGSQDSVMFLGPQFAERKSASYHYCDAFILPSFSEGLPMAVLEAWVNSKPVVMTPQCNLRIGFSTGAALEVEPTCESVSQGLSRLFGMSESERKGMGGRGFALAANRYVWAHVARQMKIVYEWVLGGGGRPGCMADF